MFAGVRASPAALGLLSSFLPVHQFPHSTKSHPTPFSPRRSACFAGAPRRPKLFVAFCHRGLPSIPPVLGAHSASERERNVALHPPVPSASSDIAGVARFIVGRPPLYLLLSPPSSSFAASPAPPLAGNGGARLRPACRCTRLGRRPPEPAATSPAARPLPRLFCPARGSSGRKKTPVPSPPAAGPSPSVAEAPR